MVEVDKHDLMLNYQQFFLIFAQMNSLTAPCSRHESSFIILQPHYVTLLQDHEEKNMQISVEPTIARNNSGRIVVTFITFRHIVTAFRRKHAKVI